MKRGTTMRELDHRARVALRHEPPARCPACGSGLNAPKGDQFRGACPRCNVSLRWNRVVKAYQKIGESRATRRRLRVGRRREAREQRAKALATWKPSPKRPAR